MEDVTAQLLWIGLSEERAKQTMKNEALTKLLLEMIAILWKGGNSGEVLDRDVGKLVYLAATTTKIQIRQHLPLVLEYLASKKIDSEAKLAAATEFLLVNPTSVDIQQFEQSAGVGLTVTQQQIADTVKAQIEKNRSELLEKRYRFGLGCILGDLRKDKILRFADGKAIKAEVDAQVLALLGPKNESDNAKPKKEPKEGNKENKKAVDAAAKEKECKDIVELLKRISFHGVGENYKTDGYVITPNTMKLLSEHVRVTGGKVFTQFPPEPNGILHIGHVKTINFSYAQANDGHCYLRYDDTNPEKEEERFVVGIKCMVEWLGYKPYKITYYTNYFDELYAFAVTLIKKDLAYTCPKNCNNINRLPPPSTSFSSSSSPLKSGASWEFIYKRSLHCSNAQNRRLKCFM